MATRRALLLLHSLPTVLLSFPIYFFSKIPACVALALPGGRWVPAVWHGAVSLSSCLPEATRQRFKVGRLRLNSGVHSQSVKITLWQQYLRRQLARLDRNCPPWAPGPQHRALAWSACKEKRGHCLWRDAVCNCFHLALQFETLMPRAPICALA